MNDRNMNREMVGMMRASDDDYTLLISALKIFSALNHKEATRQNVMNMAGAKNIALTDEKIDEILSIVNK